ncbi:DUF411 domain-containing protein [Halomonas urumqiensis]|uniref:Metal-binding protein n=1 Tax=Halomonas urumqiensis TaxID=1684789 RepID=A0A2N7UEX0_9GAMM|nr:DUF411 domain-containing protein [Halomonas urumqiensis]PMR78977.1 metal-binding protein [Halomonas urumqiensis]PTB00971.1 DUF411 domain-containing protein [Halomonas urumqiensis]GHE22914.1 copper amine oxidase [Halomonas urumqiensis]
MKRTLRPLASTVLLVAMASSAWAKDPVVTVYKDPNCGCCSAWAEHLEDSGFEVRQHDTRDMRAVKIEHGVSPELSSCHTAVVDGYVIEGHVPADDIHRLLDEKSELAGLAVPGMPHGSPGMETGRVDDYAVLGWHHDDRTPDIFSEYTH